MRESAVVFGSLAIRSAGKRLLYGSRLLGSSRASEPGCSPLLDDTCDMASTASLSSSSRELTEDVQHGTTAPRRCKQDVV